MVIFMKKHTLPRSAKWLVAVLALLLAIVAACLLFFRTRPKTPSYVDSVLDMKYQHTHVVSRLEPWESGRGLDILTEDDMRLSFVGDEMPCLGGGAIPVGEIQPGDILRVSTDEPGIKACYPGIYDSIHYITFDDTGSPASSAAP